MLLCKVEILISKNIKGYQENDVYIKFFRTAVLERNWPRFKFLQHALARMNDLEDMDPMSHFDESF